MSARKEEVVKFRIRIQSDIEPKRGPGANDADNDGNKKEVSVKNYVCSKVKKWETG